MITPERDSACKQTGITTESVKQPSATCPALPSRRPICKLRIILDAILIASTPAAPPTSGPSSPLSPSMTPIRNVLMVNLWHRAWLLSATRGTSLPTAKSEYNLRNLIISRHPGECPGSDYEKFRTRHTPEWRTEPVRILFIRFF